MNKQNTEFTTDIESDPESGTENAAIAIGSAIGIIGWSYTLAGPDGQTPF